MRKELQRYKKNLGELKDIINNVRETLLIQIILENIITC